MSDMGGTADVTNRILGALLAKDIPMPEGAPLLARLGIVNADIAMIYGTTEGSVRSAVSRGRRKDSGSSGS